MGGVFYAVAVGQMPGQVVLSPDSPKAPGYLALPNVLCVGGSWMLPKAALAEGDYSSVEKLAREAATQELADALASQPAVNLPSFLKQPQLTLLGGGIPIVVNGQVVIKLLHQAAQQVLPFGDVLDAAYGNASL